MISIFHRNLAKHSGAMLLTPKTRASMRLLIRGFIKKKFHLIRFIDNTFGSYYREVYSKNASGHKLSVDFTQKSTWTVITQYLPG